MSSSKMNLNLYFETKDTYANKKINDEVSFDLLRASVKIRNAFGRGKKNEQMEHRESLGQ